MPVAPAHFLPVAPAHLCIWFGRPTLKIGGCHKQKEEKIKWLTDNLTSNDSKKILLYPGGSLWPHHWRPEVTTRRCWCTLVPVLAWHDVGESEDDTHMAKHWEDIMDHNFIEDEAYLNEFVLVLN